MVEQLKSYIEKRIKELRKEISNRPHGCWATERTIRELENCLEILNK